MLQVVGQGSTKDDARRTTLGDITKKEGYDVFTYQVMKSFRGSLNPRMKNYNMQNTYGFVVTWWKRLYLE